MDLASPSSSSGRTAPAESSGAAEDSGAAEGAAPPPARTREKRPSPGRIAPAAPGSAAGTRAGGTGSHKAVKAAQASSSRRGRPEVEGDEAERSGRQSFKRGVPLAVKIAVFTAVLVAVLMAGVGWNLFTISSKEIDHQINQKGVSAANLYASLVDPICFYKGGEEGGPCDQAIGRWQKKLETFVTSHDSMFLNIMFTTDPKGEKPIVNGKHVQLTAVPVVEYTPSLIGDIEGVEIYACDGYKSESFMGRVRKYVRKVEAVPLEAPPPKEASRPRRDSAVSGSLPSPDSEPLVPQDAYVHVFLKAAEIDRVRDETLSKLAIATGVGIGIAILLSIAVAAYLAAPLRALVEDMRVVANGKLDHKTYPRSSDEIGLVAAQFNEMTRSLRAAQKLEQERQAIEHELTIATEIQTKLLPERIPQIPGFDLYSFYLSAKEVGGDYYDFLVIDPTHLGLVVADVSGKGVPGAMVMTMVRSLLRLASHRETSPAETLKKVNRILAKDIRRGMFVTAIYAVLDVQHKRLTVSSAGHNPMVYYNAKTGECKPVNPNGIALGFDKGRTFDENIREETIDLGPGDRFVLYTDGVAEAMSERHEEFGMERFIGLVKATATASSKDFTHSLVEALEDHRGKGDQSDDITITTLKVE